MIIMALKKLVGWINGFGVISLISVFVRFFHYEQLIYIGLCESLYRLLKWKFHVRIITKKKSSFS